MKVGLIARADSRGLGVQTKAFHDQMRPAKTMVVDCPSAKPLPLRQDWYPGATWITGLPTASDFRGWLDGLDVVYTAETGYGSALWSEAQRAGVKTVLHANYEFLDRGDQPTLWAAPSRWHLHDFPPGARFLPVPIETERFTPRPRAGAAVNFLHIVGRPAIHDRNGTQDLLAALAYVRSTIRLTVKCQVPGYVEQLFGGRPPANVDLVIDTGDVPDYWDNYRDQDVLVLPRRFGGLCLPANEAIGAGMPVVMPDVSPNNAWLPPEWLVPAGWCHAFHAKQRIDVYSANHQALAAKIDQFATDDDFYAKATAAAADLALALSWTALKPEYDRVLGTL